MKTFSCLKWLFMCLLGIMVPMSSAYAIDLGAMLSSIARDYPNEWRLITAAAYLSGWALVMFGIIKMKRLGSQQMMGHHIIMGPALAMILSGAALIYSPTMFQALNTSLFGSPDISPLAIGTTEIANWDVLVRDVEGFIQIVGLIAFIRGWFIMSKLGREGGSHQGGFGKGLTHIIGGVLAINIEGTKDVVFATLGI